MANTIRSHGSPTITFVDRHVRSLTAWDVLVFFEGHPDAVLDLAGLATRLGRPADDLRPEIEVMCRDDMLQYAGGLVRYRPCPELRKEISEFVEACRHHASRMELIARVLR